MLFVTAPFSVGAETELTPLSNILDGNPEKSYEFVRCAAYHLANIEWAGQALSEEMFDRSQNATEALLLIASLVRSAESADGIEHISHTVNLDTRLIADLYIDNYRQSYALRGTAWEANPIWESDSATCQPITEAAIQIVAELGDS